MDRVSGRSWVCMLLLCMGVGCASGVMVEANGSRKTDQPIPPHVTYAVFPTGEVEKDPAFSTYARLVAAEMNRRDYKETDPKVAKLGVFLAYGVTERAQAGTSNLSATMPSSSTYGTGSAAPSSPASAFQRYVSQVVVIVADLPQSRSAGDPIELWRGQARTEGPSKDLPGVAPLLVQAAFRHFDQTTAQPVRHSFEEEDLRGARAGR